MSYIGGVDVGATSTKYVLTDLRGGLVSWAIGPGINPFMVGYEAAAEVMLKTLKEAMRGVCEFRDLACIVFGSTGLETAKSREIMRDLIKRRSGLSEVVVATDSRIALEGALGGGEGVVIYAGTGSFAIGKNARGEVHKAGGVGFLMSDEGSGFYLGHQALRAAVRDLDGRGEKTVLTRRILEHFGVEAPEELMSKFYTKPIDTSAIAALAPIVTRAAKEGDQVAREIVTSAVQELVSLVEVVARKLNMLEVRFPLASAGGVFKSQLIRELFHSMIEQRLPKAYPIEPKFKPVIGAVIMALRTAGVSVEKEALKELEMLQNNLVDLP